jgi:hypothetical protein
MSTHAQTDGILPCLLGQQVLSAWLLQIDTFPLVHSFVPPLPAFQDLTKGRHRRIVQAQRLHCVSSERSGSYTRLVEERSSCSCRPSLLHPESANWHSSQREQMQKQQTKFTLSHFDHFLPFFLGFLFFSSSWAESPRTLISSAKAWPLSLTCPNSLFLVSKLSWHTLQI